MTTNTAVTFASCNPPSAGKSCNIWDTKNSVRTAIPASRPAGRRPLIRSAIASPLPLAMSAMKYCSLMRPSPLLGARPYIVLSRYEVNEAQQGSGVHQGEGVGRLSQSDPPVTAGTQAASCDHQVEHGLDD